MRKDLFILREFLSSAAGGLRPFDCHVHWACGECLDHQRSRTMLVRGQDYRRLRCCVSQIADEARKLRQPTIKFLNFYHVLHGRGQRMRCGFKIANTTSPIFENRDDVAVCMKFHDPLLSDEARF